MKLLDSVFTALPKVKGHLRTLAFLCVIGVSTGFFAYPIYVLYRNENAITEYITATNQRRLNQRFSPVQMREINIALKRLTDNTEATRATFGVYEQGNRIILTENFRAFDAPLPLGFMSVYLDTGDYQKLKQGIDQECFTLFDIEPDTYFGAELGFTGSTVYKTCGASNFFLALYLPWDDISADRILGTELNTLRRLLP